MLQAWPSKQAVHCSGWLRLVLLEKVPLLQVRGAAAPRGQNAPLVHGLQLVCATSSLNVPPLHASHDASPGRRANDPAVQLDQVPQDEPGIVVAVEEVELSEVSEVSEEGIGSDRRSIALEPLMP